MGLDMYLKKRTYIGANHEHRNVKGDINITIDGKPVRIDFGKISYIEEEVGYWRKSYAVHNWFCTNCAGGVDNCETIEVSHEQLKQLYDDCKKAKNKKTDDHVELLPADEYDEYYYRDLEATMDILFKALATSDENSEFYYRASW